MATKRHIVSASITPGMKQKLKRNAKKLGITMGAYIRQIIESEFEKLKESKSE